MTSSRRGPWTPSMRWSSMSLVADGPLIHVCGRVGSRRTSASGTLPDDPVRRHDADVEVGQQAERPSALGGAAVEDDRAGLGDGDRAVRDDPVDRVEVGPGQRRVVPARTTSERSSQVRWDAGRDGQPPGRPGDQDVGDDRRQRLLGRAVDGRPVVADTLDEQLDHVDVGGEGGLVVARDRRTPRVGPRSRRGSARGRPSRAPGPSAITSLPARRRSGATNPGTIRAPGS